MADNYLEKRYDEVFGHGKVSGISLRKPTLDQLLHMNRSFRGYDKSYTVHQLQMEAIVGVNTKVASSINGQRLRFRLVTKGPEADTVLKHIRMGRALPELNLPFPGTEPEAFIIVCTTAPENASIDIDLGISLQSMLLKAVEMDLNGICICAFNREAVTAALPLPYEPLAIVAIGKGAERIRLVPIHATDDHAYYRTPDGIHCVPKLQLDDLLI